MTITYDRTKNEYHAYRRLADLKSRCYNPKGRNYYKYGGAGITICDEWRTNSHAFVNWCMANGFERGFYIGRKEVDKGYSPENCYITTTQPTSRPFTRKLSAENILEIISSPEGHRKLAKKFGVSKNIIREHRDRYARGFQRRKRVKDNSKLTLAQVAEIRTSPLTNKELALKFDVHHMTIGNVRRGKTFRE